MFESMSFTDLLMGLAGTTVIVAILASMWTSVRSNRASTYGRCEECAYDMRATQDRCPECGWRPGDRRESGRIDARRLRDAAPADRINVRLPEPTEELTVVYETDHAGDAEVLREQLVARGMSCELVARESGAQQGARLDRPVYTEFVVWSGDADVARALIERATRTEEAREQVT